MLDQGFSCGKFCGIRDLTLSYRDQNFEYLLKGISDENMPNHDPARSKQLTLCQIYEMLLNFHPLAALKMWDVIVVVSSLVELATDSESTASSHSLPAQVCTNLAQLSLVCLQHCTTVESCIDSEASAVKRHLFDTVGELLLASPAILTDMLSLLLKIVSGKAFLTTFPCLGD